MINLLVKEYIFFKKPLTPTSHDSDIVYRRIFMSKQHCVIFLS